ncbi:FAR1-RELATED SEQUENCE 5 protein [Nymphaea thermarum]|nr:FAR1-RELATED SEQUENCE 5 protein [Nymphaea thermarum]
MEDATYNCYAFCHGFNVRNVSCETKHRIDTRCDCAANLELERRPNENYYIRAMTIEHNHPLAPSCISRMLRSHHKLSSSHAEINELTNGISILPKKAYNLFIKVKGSHENFSITHIDHRNHLRRKKTKSMKGGEVMAWSKLFEKD